jgi:hypothetical protein
MPHKTSLRTGTKQVRRHEPTQRQLDALRPTQFKPGQSGCPGGRPKLKPITDELRRLLHEPYKGSERRFRGMTNLRALAERTFELAFAGSLAAIILIADRVEGKVAQRQEWSGPDGDPILWGGYATRAEAEERLDFLISKAGLTNSSIGEKQWQQ